MGFNGFWNQQEEEEQNFWETSSSDDSDFWETSSSDDTGFWQAQPDPAPGFWEAPTQPVNDGEFHAAFMTGSYNPWNAGSYDDSMDTAFGSDNWDKYNGFDDSIFNGAYDFIWLDGGDHTSTEFIAFVDDNRALIENYVNDGGTLLINAARNESREINVDLGFGATLIYGTQNSVTVDNTANDLIDGDNGYAGQNFTGSYFSHDYVTGSSLDPLITGDTNGQMVLGGMEYGAGYVAAGGMTAARFHSPQDTGGNAQNLEANILDYIASQSEGYMGTQGEFWDNTQPDSTGFWGVPG